MMYFAPFLAQGQTAMLQFATDSMGSAHDKMQVFAHTQAQLTDLKLWRAMPVRKINLSNPYAWQDDLIDKLIDMPNPPS